MAFFVKPWKETLITGHIPERFVGRDEQKRFLSTEKNELLLVERQSMKDESSFSSVQFTTALYKLNMREQRSQQFTEFSKKGIWPREFPFGFEKESNMS